VQENFLSELVKRRAKSGRDAGAKAGQVESDQAKLRRAGKMIDKLLVESQALAIRAAEMSVRAAKKFG